MDIHEYQAKELLAQFGVPVPRGGLAYSPEQAAYRAREIGGEAWVVKAQIHSGGRGKAGGVKLCRDEHEVEAAADELLGRMLVTEQTGRARQVVSRLYVEAAVEWQRELYLGFVLDRKIGAGDGRGLLGRRHGDRGDRARAARDADPDRGRARRRHAGVPGARDRLRARASRPGRSPPAVATILGCYRAFRELDATMVEINPLIVTEEGRMLGLDAKMSFDDNALFRRPQIAELRDKSQEDPRETQAADRGLSYVGLEGDIGCIVNGAGLAMATMDMIKLAGGEPANFLDIGGGATPERVAKAFRLVTMDRNVKAVLVNIFAGINRCDWVAQGVVKAVEMEPLERAAGRAPRRHPCRGGPRRSWPRAGSMLITATEPRRGRAEVGRRRRRIAA